MPRKRILTTEQIDEVLSNPPSEIKILTWKAIQNFLQIEKNRRIKSAELAGRRRIYEGDAKERNKLAARNYRKNNKSGESLTDKT